MARCHCEHSGVNSFLNKGLTLVVNEKRRLVGRCHYMSHTLGFCFLSLSSTGVILSAITSTWIGSVLVLVSKS